MLPKNPTNPRSEPVRTIDLTPQARSLIQLINAGASTVSDSRFTGRFGPGYPPMPIEPETEPRLFEYQPGVNLMMIPRMGFGLLPFSSLRAMAQACKEIRLNIEYIKRTMRGIDWDIVPNDKKKTVVNGKTYVATPETDSVRKFFQKPDGVNNFAAWLNMVVEEILVTDSLTLWASHEDRELVGVEVIDGTTIKPLLDMRGRTPRPPMPAYLQIIYGTPSSAYPSNTLLYRPLNTKVNSPYGESPIEWILTSINTAIRKDLSSVGYFADGNIPGAFYTVPESWTPEQIQTFQDYIDALMIGDISRIYKLLAVPGGTGSHVTQFQQNDQDNVTLNEYLMRVACWAYGNNPAEFGLTAGAGLGGAGFMDGSQNAQQRSMIGPVSQFLESILTEITHDFLRRPDLRFSFVGLDPVEDRGVQVDIDQKNVDLGVYTVAYVQDRDAIPQEYRPAIVREATPQAGAGATLPMTLPPGYERYLKAAVNGDLEKWKDKQLRALKKGWGVVSWKSDVIPPKLSAQIHDTLNALETTKALDEASVTSVFAYASTTDLLAKGDYQGHPFRGNQHTDGSGDFDGLENISTKRPERLPDLKEGDVVVIDGHRGAVKSVRVQSRTDHVFDDLDPSGPSREVQRKVTTVRIVNDAMQEMKFTFGGMNKDEPAGDLEKRDPRHDAEYEMTKDLESYFGGLVNRIADAVKEPAKDADNE